MVKKAHRSSSTPSTTKLVLSGDPIQTHLAASREAAKEILSSKEKSIAFLVRAGILDKHGKGLAKPYR